MTNIRRAKRQIFNFTALVLAFSSQLAIAQVEVTAVLAGHAFVPATTTAAAPAEAGPLFATAGKFTAGNRQRNDKLNSFAGVTFVGDAKYPRNSGGSLPITGQSVQGFSGIVSLGADRFLVLTDNGFGNKINSQDALLMVHTAKTDWTSGKVMLEKTTFLHDPDRKIPFFIVNENTAGRYLTGSDFDPESIQVVGDEWWIGDEFGPYVLRVTPQGKVLGVIETVVAGKAYRSPDHYLNGRIASNYPADTTFETRRSGGFEPMAKAIDGKTLYPMFEWPLWDAQAKAQESRNGKPFTRILELDVASQTYRDKQYKYAFEEVGNIAADFQMLNATTGLVIERDDTTEGAGPNCPNEPRVDCFTRPAKFKRIYKIDLSQLDADGFVKKVAFIDLTKISNPKNLAKRGPNEASFALPHLGPEGLTVVDANHIVVVNDNNFPFSSGRAIGQPDDNELTLLNIKALVDAR
ncbi:MAG: esterase-like activity of phytase family protein [Pseudomonadota bacterium]